MVATDGFFSGSTNKDKRIAGNYSIEDKKNVQGVTIKLQNNPNYKPKSYELDSLYRQRKADNKPFFSPSGNEVGQIASATTDLSGLAPRGSDAFRQEADQYERNMLKNTQSDQFGERGTLERQQKIDDSYDTYRKFRYENDPGGYIRGQDFSKGLTGSTDTKIAMGDNLGSFGAIGGVLGLAGLGIKGIQSAIEGGKNLKENIEKRLNPESVQDKVGGFFNAITGTQPVAAGTLDDKPTRFAAQVSPTGYEPAGPKLNYVNPDAKTMTMGQIGEAFKPSNLFGYKDKLGRYDDPGSPLDRQRQETMQNVYNKFTSPIVGDPRSIAQIRADQKATMQENARLRNEAFQNRDTGPASTIQKTFGADDTYGTGVPSNPAMGFSGKMSEEAKAKYAQSAKEATAGAQPDSSLGNVMTQTYNRIASKFGLPQKNLESVDDRQKRLAQKAFDKPRYQQEAYARRMLGITNDQLKARNLQQIRENAFSRNQAFQADRAQRAVEKAAIRRGGNIGTGRDGGFGLGTTGQGMPSNPKGFSGYSRKSSPGTGTGTSSSRGGISKSTSRGQGGGASSRSKGGTSKGGSKAKSSGSRGQGGGSASRSKGGTGTGQSRSGGTTGRTASRASKSRTGRSRSQCDIRTKIDIAPLTNEDLIRDDLANVAYFVKEIK